MKDSIAECNWQLKGQTAGLRGKINNGRPDYVLNTGVCFSKVTKTLRPKSSVFQICFYPAPFFDFQRVHFNFIELERLANEIMLVKFMYVIIFLARNVSGSFEKHMPGEQRFIHLAIKSEDSSNPYIHRQSDN